MLNSAEHEKSFITSGPGCWVIVQAVARSNCVSPSQRLETMTTERYMDNLFDLGQGKAEKEEDTVDLLFSLSLRQLGHGEH